eukprot:scaffold289114_cov31-Tisochrysis_lutea.AAC.6
MEEESPLDAGQGRNTRSRLGRHPQSSQSEAAHQLDLASCARGSLTAPPLDASLDVRPDARSSATFSSRDDVFPCALCSHHGPRTGVGHEPFPAGDVLLPGGRR